MNQKYIVALEFSGSQVKGALASVPDNSNVSLPTVEAIVAEDNCDCVQYGRVQNVANAQKYATSVIRRLSSEPSVADGHIDNFYVGLSGHSLGSEKTSAEITLPSEMEITKDIVLKLLAEASRNVSVNKKVLRVLPRRFYVDNQPMSDPVGTLGSRLRGDLTLVTCNPVNQRNIDMVLHDKMGMNVAEYVVTPLAIADMVLGEEEKQLGCMLVDIGAQTTTISIYKDRCLQYLATLPMGSANITRDICMGLNLTLEKAEILKCDQGNAMPDSDRHDDENAMMNRYVAARAFEIAANINSNIAYASYTPSDLSGGIILCGRGAKLKNMANLISDLCKLNVREASVPNNFTFALNTNNLHPSDYLSLLAIINKVAHKHNILSSFVPNIVIPDTQENKVENKVEKNSNPVSSNFKPVDFSDSKEVKHADWDKDDPEPDVTEYKPEDNTETIEEKKPSDTTSPKRRKSLLAGLKDSIYKMVRDDSDLDNDTYLDS